VTPYFAKDGIVLYLGCCEDVLLGLADGSVDHCITDPPFEVEAHTNGRRAGLGGRGATAGSIPRPLSFGMMTPELRAIAAREVARLTLRWVLTFCQIEAAMCWRSAYEVYGLGYRRTCIWRKPDGAPQFTGDRPGMGYETFVAMHPPGRSRWNGGGRHGVFEHRIRDDHGVPPRLHETQKPLSLMRELVALFSEPGETILDPFAGSCTTLVAAQIEGRKAIGIECEEKWAEVGARRLEHSDAAARRPMQGVMLLR